MPARQAPQISSVDKNNGTVVVRYPNGAEYTKKVGYLDKVTLIKVGTFLKVQWNGTPMHKSLDDIKRIVTDAMNGTESVPTPAEPSVPRPVRAESKDSVSVDEAIRRLLASIPQGIDESAVRELVRDFTAPKFVELGEMIAKIRPQVTEVHIPNREVRKLDGVQHKQFTKVLQTLGCGLNVFMVGSAGTGKTTIAERAAQALGLEFSAQSFNAQSSKSDLVGFTTANGVYVGTEFRKRFEFGGVYLMDEIDNANPNILGTLNAALANGYMAFPDGMVKRHDGFVAIAAGNTYGNGATAQYVGRNPIDGATKDRFVFMDILIDENVEDAMMQAEGLDAETLTKWTTVVRSARANVQSHGLQVIVSPRSARDGARLLKAGFTTTEVVNMTILKGAKQEVSDKVLAGVTL